MSLDPQPRLSGQHLTLRPLTLTDLEPLWSVSRDPLIWEQHPDKTRSDRAGFGRFFAAALESNAALAVLDKATGEVIGSTRFYDVDPQRRETAIGYTFLARRYWGGPWNAEMKQLLLAHALAEVDRVWFHVAATNWRSRRAMEKIGARLSHHGPRPQNGEMMDFCYYVIEKPWPRMARS